MLILFSSIISCVCVYVYIFIIKIRKVILIIYKMDINR